MENETSKPEAPGPAISPAPAPPVQPQKYVRLLKKLEKLKNISIQIKDYVSDVVSNPLDSFRELDIIGKLKFTLIILLCVLFGVVIKYWGGQWLDFFKDDTVYRLDDKATKVYEINPQNTKVEFDQDLLTPQYIVLLNKVVVNLKRSESSGENPMAAFNLYLHATNEDTAIEIKDRERELQDFVQRVTEDLSYNQILTEEGKLKWKQLLKGELNMVLTRGKIKDIYFNTLIIKP